MSEMSDWIAQLQNDRMFTRPEGERPVNVTEPPPTSRVPDAPYLPPPNGIVTPTPDPYGYTPELPGGYTAPPWAGDPGIPAPLAQFLRNYASGYNTGVTPEMYQYFGGDQIIDALRKYDPNARWVDTDLGGGEGGGSMMGRRLEYNQGMLPAGAGPGWMSPVSLNSDRLRNPGMQYYDPVYGWVTDPRNVYHKSEGIEKWAPAIAAGIAAGGPALGSFLASAGIGAGAGGTAAVTGGAAGLPAGNIAMGGQPAWWTNWLGKAPRTVGPILSGGPTAPSTNPVPRVPAPTGGTPPMFKRSGPDVYGFDPSAFNAAGSQRKPSGNDSSLVATQFADDPYGFSR